MDQRCHTFLFGHYHQAPGASCGILSCLLSFLCNPYTYMMGLSICRVAVIDGSLYSRFYGIPFLIFLICLLVIIIDQ